MKVNKLYGVLNRAKKRHHADDKKYFYNEEFDPGSG